MAYNENTANRIAEKLLSRQISFTEKKMFGGIAFMIEEKMCIGVTKEQIMLRVMDEKYPQVMEMHHTLPMQFTGKTMKGFVFIEPEGFDSDVDLDKWIDYAEEFGKYGIVKSKKRKES